jgi:hypothetical protein
MLIYFPIYIFIYVFMVYFMKLSAAKAAQH